MTNPNNTGSNPPTPSALSAEEVESLCCDADNLHSLTSIGPYGREFLVRFVGITRALNAARNQARTPVEPGDIEELPDALAYVAMCMDPGDRKNTVNQAVEALRGFAARTPVSDGGASYELVKQIGRLTHTQDDGYFYPDDNGEADCVALDGLIAQARDIMADTPVTAVPSDRTPVEDGGAETIEAVAKALFEADADFGYSMNLTRLVEDEATYTLQIKGEAAVEYPGTDECYEHIAKSKSRKRAAAVLAALAERTPVEDGGAREAEMIAEAVEFIDNWFQPWGAWKTAWWEGAVSDDAAMTEDNALKAVANILRRAALATSREGER